MTTRPSRGVLGDQWPVRRAASCSRLPGLGGRDPRELAASRARHPSAACAPTSVGTDACAGCGYVAAGPSTAARAVSDLVVLARRVLELGDEADDLSGRVAASAGARFERVARLRDELHATANRVERFRLTDVPMIDLVRVHATRAATMMLSLGQILHQLDLVGDRLVVTLGALTPAEWRRVARVGDDTITLGGVVDDVVHAARHDLLELVAVGGALQE